LKNVEAFEDGSVWLRYDVVGGLLKINETIGAFLCSEFDRIFGCDCMTLSKALDIWWQVF